MSIPTYGEVGAQGLFLSPNVQVRFLEDWWLSWGKALRTISVIVLWNSEVWGRSFGEKEIVRSIYEEERNSWHG
jgi:hypothetical protein